MTDGDSVLAFKRQGDGLLYFPFAETEDETFADAIKKSGARLSLILTRHDEGQSTISYYYVLEGKTPLFFPLPRNIEAIWIRKDNMMMLLDDYAGEDPEGAKTEEREFIAMMNII